MGLLGWLNQQKRIAELEDVVTKLHRKMEDCELDWADMRARCKRLLDRTEKAAARVAQAEEGVESTAAGTGEGIVASNGAMHHGPLSEHQKQIQQQVLRRRAGG
jgi:chromosome segregation ATPase